MRAYAQKQNSSSARTSLNLPSSSLVRVQTKLRVNTPGDIYEQEADRVAEEVTHLQDSQVDSARSSGNPSHQHGFQALRTKGVQANDSGQIEAPSIVEDALRSVGQALDTSTLSFMESRFGHDFSQVRVHTDPRAADAASAMAAHAFTSGSNIVFNHGAYAPQTESGRKLLAHELTHVAQQQARDNRRDNLERTEAAIHRKPDAQPHKTSRSPISLSGEFLVQDSKGNWFVFEMSCTMPTTTAIDELRVKTASVPAGPTLNFSMNNCNCSMVPLAEYEANARQAVLDKSARQFAMLGKQSDAIKPAYIEFDLIFLWKQPAEFVLSKVFSIGGLAGDLLGGDYEGGLGEAIKDGLLGFFAEKGIVKLFKVPPTGKKLEVMKEIAKGEIKKTIERPNSQKND